MVPIDVVLPAIFPRALGLGGGYKREVYHIFNKSYGHLVRETAITSQKRPLQAIIKEFGCVSQQIMKLLM